MAGRHRCWQAPVISILLATMTFAVFGQTLRFDFVNYDDDLYVYDNPVVARGLTLDGFRWALTFGEIGHWHPLTWLSHMLDCQIYGLHAGGHHLTNVLLHTTATILLFLVLRHLTGFLWRSAFVAAVFAIHPLRAESVAWIAERKDVLSAVFFMLTVGAYIRFVRQPPSAFRYGCVILLYALGLLSKNMLVTLPFVLLLLDYWPLGRFADSRPQILRRLIVEKIPLLLLAMASCVATALVPEELNAGDRLPFALRMENALVSCVIYLWQMIHPARLACYYPNPTNALPFWEWAGALGLLLAISSAAFAFRKTRPYLIVGWLWYLGMLIPVIGIVQISHYAHADRYAYLPQIGLYLLLAWAAAEFCSGWRHRHLLLGGLSIITLASLMILAHRQTAFWRNSETLWSHALNCTADNVVVRNNLGDALLAQGRVDDAIVHFQKALELNPAFARSHNDLGNALLQNGRADEAAAHFRKALELNPALAQAHNNLGNVLLQIGRVDEAIVQYQQGVELKPDLATFHYSLGKALLQKGRLDEAIIQCRRALELNPDFMEARNNLGNALFQKGRLDDAVVQYQQALAIAPSFAEVHNNLGNALLQKGQLDAAIIQYQQAVKLDPASALCHYSLGNALLQVGRVDEAIVQCQKTLELSPDFVEGHNNLGNALLQKGRVDEAIVQCQKALAINPGFAASRYNLGNAFLQKGQINEAANQFEMALESRPNFAEAELQLGKIYFQTGQTEKAIASYQKVLEFQPLNVEAQNNLAWVLATASNASLRNDAQAIKLAEQANQLAGDANPIILNTLAVAYAGAGRFPEAIKTARQALPLAKSQSSAALVDAIQKEIDLYQTNLPSTQLVPPAN